MTRNNHPEKWLWLRKEQSLSHHDVYLSPRFVCSSDTSSHGSTPRSSDLERTVYCVVIVERYLNPIISIEFAVRQRHRVTKRVQKHLVESKQYTWCIYDVSDMARTRAASMRRRPRSLHRPTIHHNCDVSPQILYHINTHQQASQNNTHLCFLYTLMGDANFHCGEGSISPQTTKAEELGTR